MTSLQAAWLSSWKAPWSLDRGRRWGDPAWALACLAQAWLMGGREGRWPHTQWEARWPHGPHPMGAPEGFEPRPPEDWVALLRHGSRGADPRQRGAKESDLAARCWEALLHGDGRPWMALGSVLLDRATRTRWIPLLAAVDAEGTLHLPPFQEGLVPEWMRHLPPGWWPCLLSAMDAEGRLLPEGQPPAELASDLLDPSHRACLDPLVLPATSPPFPPALRDRWGICLDGGRWMLDPRVRAWNRGLGLCAKALAPLVPPSPRLGDPLPLSALTATEPVPDLLEVTADPCQWLAKGEQAMEEWRVREALEAFEWAHAHFSRLKHVEGRARASAGASQAALFLGAPRVAMRWAERRGSLSVPLAEEAWLQAARGDWTAAVRTARKALEGGAGNQDLWTLLAWHAVLTQTEGDAGDVWPQLESCGLRTLPATLSERHSTGAPSGFDAATALLWSFRRALPSKEERTRFWQTWEASPCPFLQLETGLRLLASDAAERTPTRLLRLGALVDTNDSPLQRERLQALFPAPPQASDRSPEEVVQTWLQQRARPTWLVWGAVEDPSTLGVGPAPPAGFAEHVRRHGGLPPMETAEGVWWGQVLEWEGSPVGAVLASFNRNEALRMEADTFLLAPWLARMTPPPAPQPVPEKGELLTDGSEPMESVLRDLRQVAPSALPVLILGPTGSGKELAAREIHHLSGRSGPFYPVNCSEYVETLMESELFGHVKGAFTGADRDRKGAIEQTEGGTLFLDEVADLSPRLQSLLLRVLQEKEVRRVGSEKIHKVNVRFLAATHRPLEQLVAEGHFRKDLHFRLRGAVLTLPSLAERKHEFPYLIPRLASRVAAEAGLDLPDVAPGLPATLARHAWPGNFRELRHAIERALMRRTDAALKAIHFPELETAPAESRGWDEATRTFQHAFLLRTLRQHGFRMTAAADQLGLTRPALYLAARRLGLDLARERQLWNGRSE